MVSSLFLALAQSIWPLLFWRAVQAIGSGGISAMALAIVKDVLRGRAMEKVITVGISDDRFIEVESGLNQGDKIVVKGYEFLRNRGKVKIMK